jgi:hypothetical protein
MGLTASCVDRRSSKQSCDQISKLVDYISGELNNDSLEFLQNACSRNSQALDKLLVKCERLGLKLKACDINLVVEALQTQMDLPQNIFATIKNHLLDKRMNSIANVLHIFSEKLENKLPATDVLKPIFHVLNNLSIFVNASPEEQFLRSILTMMLNFHNKEYSYSKPIESRRRNPGDTAKWLKSLLSMSEKSSLIKLIDFLGIRLHLAGNTINGEFRSMELTELFFIFEDMANCADMNLTHAENEEFIKDINAIILIAQVCKKAPTSLLDVVEMQLDCRDMDILNLMQEYNLAPLQIGKFFKGKNFNPYFRRHQTEDRVNPQAFLTTLSNYLHTIISYSNERFDENIQPIADFIQQCNNSSNKMTDEEYILWLKDLSLDSKMQVAIETTLFDALEHEAKACVHKFGGLGFVATKMVSMGFSPRAEVSMNTGVFHPLVTARTLQTDLENIQSLRLFVRKLDYKQKNQLMTELLLTLLVRYRKNPSKLENQPKVPAKRQADTSYPLPTLHNMRKTKNSKTVRALRNSPSYQLTFFSSSSKMKFTRNAPKSGVATVHQ